LVNAKQGEQIEPTRLTIGLRKIVFNATMRDARKAKGLTMTQLSLLVWEEAVTAAAIRRQSSSKWVQRLTSYESMRAVPPLDVAQEIADALEVPLQDIFPDMLRRMPRAKAQTLRVEANEISELGPALQEMMEGIPYRERYVLAQRAGLNGPPMTHAAIAQEVGVGRERICQLERAGLQRARLHAAAREIKNPLCD